MEKRPLSIDTALEAIGLIITSKFKELQREGNPEQAQILRNEIKILNKEMQIIYGLDGDEKIRMKVYNKINVWISFLIGKHFYSVKEYICDARITITLPNKS